MGNDFCMEPNSKVNSDNELEQFSEEERNSVKKIYMNLQKIKGNSKNNDGEISESILVQLWTDHLFLQDYNKFCYFVSDSLRSNKTTTTETTWKLFVDKEDPLIAFFVVIFEMLGVKQFESDRLSKRIVTYIRTYYNCSGMTYPLSTSTTVTSATYNCTFIDKRNDYTALINWIRKDAPCLPNILETYYNYYFLNKPPGDMNRYNKPYLTSSSDIITIEDILPLSLYHPHLQGNWIRLYTSSVDGMSFNRIAHHILGYDGPTVFIIKCIVRDKPKSDTDPTIIGVYCESGWRDSNRCHGSSNNILFSLSPSFRILKSRTNSIGAYQWLNTRTYGVPHGIGFGGSSDKGDEEQFRLYIPESLENCIFRNNDLTYEIGDLFAFKHHSSTSSSPVDSHQVNTINNSLNPISTTITTQTSTNNSYINTGTHYFDIDTIEVWGCGGDIITEKGLGKQKELRTLQNAHLEKARKVDKAQFFNNPFDREFFLSNTVGSNGSSNSRDQQQC